MGGTSAGVGEAFSPLIGIWAPTLSACEIAAVFLFPFVAIRLVSGDKSSGAAKIEMQQPLSSVARVLAKALVLVAGWLLASTAVVVAVGLWGSYGGFIYWPELATVVLGHLLNALLTIGLALAVAALAEHPATAAILTLAVTVGSWIVTFIAAVHGGVWDRVAAFTPAAMVAQFQHGLIRADVVSAVAVLVACTFAFAAIWLRTGVALRRRTAESIALAVIAACLVFVASGQTRSWDLSENRMNSFSRADEAALRQLNEPLRIEVHLAPEDPRRVDLDHRALSKLRRSVRHLDVRYSSATSIGLFEQANPNYGEIWYEARGKKAVSRAITPESVLENVYQVTGMPQPADSDEPFRGHPLPAPPRGAALIFYVLWPAVIVGFAWLANRRNS
jgi:hypothetical protein